MSHRSVTPIVLYWIVILLFQLTFIPISAEDKYAESDLICTRIVIHHCTFYSLALTKPMIKNLNQENLDECLNQTIERGATANNDFVICSGDEEEFKELKKYIDNFSKELEFEFDMELKEVYCGNCCTKKRNFIRIAPKDQKYSNIYFEYDGAHMDMVLVIDVELPLEELLATSGSIDIFPENEQAKNMQSAIGKMIGSYILEKYFNQTPINKSVHKPVRRSSRFIMDDFLTSPKLSEDSIKVEKEFSAISSCFVTYFALGKTDKETISNLEKDLEDKNPAMKFETYTKDSSDVEHISFRIGVNYYEGFIEPKELFLEKKGNFQVESYFDVAIMYHLFTLMDWEEKLSIFEKSKSLNISGFGWHSKEINELANLERNLISLRKNLPIFCGRANRIIPGKSEVINDKLEQVGWIDRKRGFLYTTYMNKRTQTLAFFSLIVSISGILVTLALFSLQKRK